MRERLNVTPARFRAAAWAALVLLTLIVFTGAAVRLTDSGLGCANWPRCTSNHLTPPDQLHALIEFGNRALSGIVGVVTVVVMLMAFVRRPLRRDLAVLATLLPLGVVAQAVLGGYTVKEKLAPGYVMAHFGLSMIILIAALALVWRTYHPAGTRPRAAGRGLVWTVRATVVLGAITIFAGTLSTAAGPHSGAHIGQIVKRLHFRGAGTLEWAVHQHATVAVLFGLGVIAAWLLKRREFRSLEPTEPLTVLGVLVAGQGLLGSVQYELKLPAEMVWLHVALATVTWVVALWAWADTGATRRGAGEPGEPEGVGEPLGDAHERPIEAAPL
ncbi:MAG: COX15/CtaA family protein [Solirubrobacteraceae bacterium]